MSEKVPLCCTQTPARDRQQYVSKKFLSLLLPLSTEEGGGVDFEIVADSWRKDFFPHYDMNRLCLPVGADWEGGSPHYSATVQWTRDELGHVPLFEKN